MPQTPTTQNDTSSITALNALYQQKVADQRQYLQQLLQNFTQRCDEITAQAQQKMALIPETDRETRLKIFEEQKNQLNTELQALQKAVTKSHNDARQELESIYNQKETHDLHQLEIGMSKVYS